MKRVLLKLNNMARKGFSVIEIVVALGIISVVMVSLPQIGALSLRLSSLASNRVQAAFLLNEGIEATRFLRDDGWGAHIEPLALDIDYFLLFGGSDYQLATVEPPFLNGKFQRELRFSEVLRNGQDDIDSVGTSDPLTKKVAVTVSWNERGATTTESVEFYITNLFDN